MGSDSGVCIIWEKEHRLIGNRVLPLLEVEFVMGKIAVITVELVDESIAHSNGAIAEELLRWFREAVAAPWVKEIKKVVVN